MPRGVPQVRAYDLGDAFSLFLNTKNPKLPKPQVLLKSRRISLPGAPCFNSCDYIEALEDLELTYVHPGVYSWRFMGSDKWGYK